MKKYTDINYKIVKSFDYSKIVYILINFKVLPYAHENVEVKGFVRYLWEHALMQHFWMVT